MSAQLLTTNLRDFYESHPDDCECFLCSCHRAAIKELGGRCPEHNLVRDLCRCPQPEEQSA